MKGMKMKKRPLPSGPFEELSWPSLLEAGVVKPGTMPRIHGYSVDEDLCRHYSFGEVLFLSLTGDLPTREKGILFENVLIRLCPVSPADGPVHAALLSRAAGATSTGTLMVGLIGLCERARHTVSKHLPLLEATRLGKPLPPGFEAKTERDHIVGKELNELWPEEPGPPMEGLTAEASCVMALSACGLCEEWQLEVALVAAGLGVLPAEAQRAPAGRLTDYPMNLPPFRYEERDEDV